MSYMTSSLPSEIQWAICRCLPKDALLHLALCKPWHEVASAMIWERIDDINALFGLLSPDVKAVTINGLNGWIKSGPDDWGNVLKRSRQVKYLHLHCLKDEIQIQIVESLAGTILCPNLVELRIGSSMASIYNVRNEFLRALIPPTLPSLVLVNVIANSKRPATDALLTCRNLSTVHVADDFLDYCDEDDGWKDDFILNTLDALCHCPVLSEVTLDIALYRRRVVLKALSRCPRLQSLRARFRLDSPSVDTVTLSYARPAFAELRNLHLQCATFGDATNILMAEDKRCMGSITVLTHESNPSRAFAPLVAAIRSRCVSQHLRSVELGKVQGRREVDSASWAITFQDLAPLLVFQRLTQVILGPPVQMMVSEDKYEKMARAWPELQLLRIRCDAHYNVEPSCTLGTLATFAQHCRQLRQIELPFAAINVPVVALSTDTEIEEDSEGLTICVPTCTRIEDPKEVAKYLGKIRSSVSVQLAYCKRNVIAMDNAGGDARRDAWEMVARLMTRCFKSYSGIGDQVT
ncbi:hypothetical protein HDZ31DRAFT_67242 [Schizophyllum fasciatum]